MIRIKNPIAPKLPSEYQEVEYIESTGTQYIDTGYTPVNGDEIEIKNVKCFNKTDYQTIFSAGTITYQWILLLSKSTEAGYANYKYFAEGGASVVTSRNLNTATTVKSNSSGLYYDGNLVASSSYGGAINTSLRLFKRANDSYPANAQMGEVTIRSGETVVRDMIPCYRLSDNVVGMYDLANDVFYTNAGTGTFLIGTEIAGRDINIKPTIGGKTLLERYIGNILVYKSGPSYVDTAFSSSPFPTSWTKTDNLNYYATNDLGEWKISSTSYANSVYLVKNTFDNIDSTYSSHKTTPNGGTTIETTMIECPCLINPKHIYFVYNRLNNGSSIEGYNPITNSWENLISISKSTSKATIDTDISTNNFYSKFRILSKENTTTGQRVLYEFQITSGTIRQEV